MAELSWPYANDAVTQDEWRAMSRLWISAGVVDGSLDELEVTPSTGALAVLVAAGEAWLDGFFYRLSDQDSVTLDAADLDDPRVDLVVVRSDLSEGNARLAVKSGTPGVAPVAPALEQDHDGSGIFEVALASVLVEASAVQVPPGNVTDQRAFTTQVRDLSGTTAERNALAGQIFEGTFFFDTDELQTFRWDGSAWQGIVDVQSIEAQLQAFVDDAETELQEFVDNSEVLLQGFVDDAEEARDDAQTAAAAAEDAAIVFAIALGG